MGYQKAENLKIDNIKTFISRVLTKNKKDDSVQDIDFNTILSNIDKCDHHDLVRTDNIITRIWNKNNEEYQWGSVVQNLKWKI